MPIATLPIVHGPHREPSGNEKWMLLGAALLALAGLIAIVLENYEPVRLAPVFMLLSWFPLIAAHEAGHAFCARQLGWDIEEVVIGFGRPVWQFTLRGMPVAVRMYPLGGFVRPRPRRVGALRLQRALIFAAGPVTELLLAGLIVLICGRDHFFVRSESIPLIFAQSVALAATFSATVNLIPFPIPQAEGGRASMSDGLGVIVSLFAPVSGNTIKDVREYHEDAIAGAATMGLIDETINRCERAWSELGPDAHLLGVCITSLLQMRPQNEVRERVAQSTLPQTIKERFTGK